MKKFLTFALALVLVLPLAAKGRNDGSTKANAIDFDWENPMTHSGGTKWYVVDLAPLYEEETPALNLFLANKDAFNETHTSLQATVAGQTDEKSFTIGPKQQRVWSANATMLVRLKQQEIYLTLTSDGPVMMSARVFEAADLDETCKDALSFSWTSGITKPAGVPVWYKVNIKDAKANTGQDVCVVVTNNGTKKLTLNAGQSLDCPSSGVTKRTIELEAGRTLRDTVPNTMLTNVAFDELYVSLENDQPITVTAEYANRPLIYILPVDNGLNYDSKVVPDTSLHKYDTMTLLAGTEYLLKYSVANLNSLKKYEPEFTFRNLGSERATISRKMSFQVPASVAQGDVLVLEAGEESIEVISKNTLIGLDATTIYVKMTSDKDIQLLSRLKHIREGKACKTNIDFNWNGGHRQEGKTTQWYAIELTDARDNMEDIIVYAANQGDATAHLDGALAFSCPYIDLQEISHTIGKGDTVSRRLGYSTYSMMSDTVWIGLTTDQDIKFWAETVPAKTKAEVDTACLTAITFDWQEGVLLDADTAVWYRIDMTKVRDLAAKFPTIYVQNLSSSSEAVITAELSVECPDSIENQKRTTTIAANGSLTKQLSRNLFENIVQDEIYLKVHSTQQISLQVRLTEEAEGASCSSAIPFNWVSGNSQNANDNLWYIVDLRKVMQDGNDIRLHIENRDNESCKAVAQLIYECPTASAPSIQDFTLAAKKEKSITVQNSAFETLSDSVAYVNLQGTTGLRFWVELLSVEDFDTIKADGLTLIPLQWDSLYTQTVDTAWYIIPNSEILKVRNLEEKAKPVAHLINLGAAMTIKAEGAFAFPIVKKMMTKSQSLKANQHFTDTVPSGTFDQIIKKDSIIIRVTRPVGGSDFQFRAELVSAFSGNTRADALPIRLGEMYSQAPNTEMWYKLNTADIKKDKDLFNKQLRVTSKNVGKGAAEVTMSVYEGLLSNDDLLEEYGLGDYRKRTLKKGEGKTRNIPAQVVYGMGDMDMYILVRTTDSLVFGSQFAGTYAPQAVDPKQAEAKLLVPNVEYVIPNDGEAHWYMVCLPYMQNNYIYTDGSKLYYEVNGQATIEVITTFQDQMDCAMPVRERTINKADTLRTGSKPLRELIEQAIKKAGYTFDFSGTAPEFMDSLLHRYITKDSVTFYVRVKTDNELKVKLTLDQTTGYDCGHAMAFDWEHGNVNPANTATWYQVRLDSLIIPDTCDLRLHVDNWDPVDSTKTSADIYFDCNEPKTKGGTYKIAAGTGDSIDIDRDYIRQIGWTDMIIDYHSDKATYIWAELIPDVPRDTIYDTIRAYVCDKSMYLDTITNIEYGPITQFTTWNDTVTFHETGGVVMIDSVTTFEIRPLVMPKEITSDSMKVLGAAPLLEQGMQLFVDSSSVQLTKYYRHIADSIDTIVRIDTVYWAKPVYNASKELVDTVEAALDLTKYYQKTDLVDTLLLVIVSDTCGFTYRKDIVFTIGEYKTIANKDTVCPAQMPATNPDAIAYLINDTLNRPRYVDTVTTYTQLVMPKSYSKEDITLLPTVAAGEAIDTANVVPSLLDQYDTDKEDTMMVATDAWWQVLLPDSITWQDMPYTVPAQDTLITMRYIIDTECGIKDTSELILFGGLTPACLQPDSILTDTTVCGEDLPFVWHSRNINGKGLYRDTLRTAAGCDSIICKLKVAVQYVSESPFPKDTTVCAASLPFTWYSNTVTAAGLYYDTLAYSAKPFCDSVRLALNVIVLGADTVRSDSTVCEAELPIIWHGKSLTASGLYHDTLHYTATGCDSVLFDLNLTVLKVDSVLQDSIVCEADLPIIWRGQTITSQGTYRDTLHHAYGCDSIRYQLTLTVLTASDVKKDSTVCAAEVPFVWHGQTIAATGIYYDTLHHAYGCDSIRYELNLTVQTAVDEAAVDSLVCAADLPFTWRGHTVTAAGTYHDTLRYAVTNCDSIRYTLNLAVQTVTKMKPDTVEACNMYSWRNFPNPFIKSGTYYDTLRNEIGCDSVIYTLSLTVNVPYEQTLSIVSKYGDRLLMINRTEINALPGWNLDLESDTALVRWYKEATPEDIFLCYGYYYTTPNGSVIDPGTYYAVLDIPASDAASCGAKGTTIRYTVKPSGAAPAIVPSLARPGETIRVINLDPEQTTTIRIFTTEGILKSVYTVSGEDTFTMDAAEANGYYLVELSNDSLKTTLRYIVK